MPEPPSPLVHPAAGPRSRQAATANLAATRAGVPTLISDKPDYHPGDSVTLTGGGWAPREIVTIFMTVEPVTHGPVTLTSTADDSGAFTNSDYVVQRSDVRVVFRATASGAMGDKAASLTFTDTDSSTSSNPLSLSVTSPGTVISGNPATFPVTVYYNTYTTSSKCPVNLSFTSGIPAGGTGGVSSTTSCNPTACTTGTATSPVVSSVATSMSITGTMTPGNYTVGITGVPQGVGTTCGNGSSNETGSAALHVRDADTLSVSAESGVHGGPVTLSATFSPAVSGETIAFAINGGAVGSGTTNSSGVATYTLNPITYAAGSYTIGASFADNGTYEAASGSNTLTVAAYGTATQLVFTTQPGNGTAGGNLSTQPVVTIEDAEGNTVASASNSITLAIGTNAGGGTLTVAANPLAASSGAATFSGVAINKTGTGYTLTAAATGLTTATSSTFNVTAATASQLVFTTQPSGGQGGLAWASFGQPVVTVEDTYGNTVTTSSASVTLAISTNPSSGTLTCTANPKTASSGVATFAGCQINNTGNGYVLQASASGLTSVYSNPFQITSPTAVTLQSVKATAQDGGVLLEWRTGFEVSNLGFHIYREDNGRRVRVTASSPVAGSALLAGAQTRLTAGNSYRWWDPEGSVGSVYFVEDIDIGGARKLSEPVSVRPGVGSPGGARRAVSRLLSEVGRAGADSPAFLRMAPAGRVPEAKTVTPTQAEKQFALAAGPAVKIGVQQAGWYRVTQPQLVAAGLDPNVNPRSLQLYANGAQQPILVEGEAGGGFGPQGAIDFYGTPVDTIWSGTQEYWLVSGKGPGLRIGSADASGGAAGATSFPSTIQWQPRTLYFAALLNGDADANSFFGPVLDAGDRLSQALTITHLDSGASGSSPLQVTLQGATAGPHAVTVTLNGAAVGNMTFSDPTNSSATFEVPNSSLQEGSNTLGLTVTGETSDTSVVDTVQLTYPHSYIADSNSLLLTAASGQKVTVSGFTDSSIQVVDITNPSEASLSPGVVSAGAVTFVAQGGGTRTLLAVGSSQIASPASIVASAGSSWHSVQPGADMVIIAHASLLSAAAPLAALRQSQGHTVQAIDVQDLYNEFDFGVESPYAIRNFLLTAQANWETKPAYVLLLGNGTFDPRNYLQTAIPDLVPVKMVDASLLETASDDWYADFNDDGIPEMAIGRIPAETVTDASNAVNRLIAYDQAGGVWKNQALLVAGVDEDPATDNFEGFTATVQALLPGTMAATKILAGSDPQASAEVLAGLNAGESLVNYVGHGSSEVWADGLLSTEQAGSLSNGSATPMVLSMTCLNGYFEDVYTEALAKALVLAGPGGGAVAVWASSALTVAPAASNLNQAMVTALYAPGATIGQAARAAKSGATDMDVRRTWILFGDPAMKLQ
jgi:hypothetical protein